MRFVLLLILNTLFVSLNLAQDKKFIRQGNASYETNDFETSELKYRKAMEKKPDSFKAAFNLGDALYKQEKYEEAAKQFEQLAISETDKLNKAKAYHNLGNTHLQTQNLEESIQAYKNALRNNPKDDKTRYNLAYAQRMLKQQQQQEQQNQDQNKDQNEDQNEDQNKEDQQDQQNKDQEEQNKDEEKKEDQQNKDQQDQKDQKQQQDQQQQEQQKQEIPKEKAEQMLKALENDEKDLQKKMKMQQVKGQKVPVEKDW